VVWVGGSFWNLTVISLLSCGHLLFYKEQSVIDFFELIQNISSVLPLALCKRVRIQERDIICFPIFLKFMKDI